MTLYEELIKRVSEGEPFYVNFKNRTLKIGKKFIIADGVYDDSMELIACSYDKLESLLDVIDNLYCNYKYSLPSERSDSKRCKYFKALSVNEMNDMQLIAGERREVARARLEGFILCVILNGKLQWDETKLGKWFYQSKTDPDLVILRSWIENN